jgi:glycosyltransferase involved in cell wall biosynthesis
VKLAVLSDLSEERWPSMDLVTEMLVEHASRLPGVEVRRIQPSLPAPLRRLAIERAAAGRLDAGSLSLALGRYLFYPFALLRLRGFDFYHVADHSYAHLAFGLPAARTGVYCHDIEVFRPLFQPTAAPWRRLLASTLLSGMRRAKVVFFSTYAVRDEIVAHRLVPEHRLVWAPYGIAPEFQPEPRAEDATAKRFVPYVLHVGSLVPRKNPAFLVRLYASLRRALGELDLVQVGGTWPPDEQSFLEREGLVPHVRQLRGISREELAAYYRNAGAVLLPSTSEGFGLPVIEAFAAGAAVVATDLPVLRQVGQEGAVYCPPNELGAWHDAVLRVLAGKGPDLGQRLTVSRTYTWPAHARTVTAAYAGLDPPKP